MNTIPEPRFKLTCLLFNRHNWLYWRKDANYRYCTRCGLWNVKSTLVTYPWTETISPRIVGE